MSQEHEHEHEHEEESPDVQVEEEDVIEVVEDDGEGMDDDDDDLANYDGEIIIGGPGPEDMDMEGMEQVDEIQDNSIGATSLHKPQQSIFALALHPHLPLAVSGGEDDLAYLFSPLPGGSPSAINADSFTPITLTGHTDSVVAAAWSADGEFVATGGMDGRVRVWRHVTGRAPGADVLSVEAWKDWEFIVTLETGSEVQWLQWHPKGNVLSAGCEDSSVWLWQLPSGNTMTVLSGHTLPCTAGVFPPPAGKQLLTASLDSTLILWNPNTSTPIFKSSIFTAANNPELDPSVHGITALAVSPNGQLAAVGSASGRVRLVSLPKGDVVGTLEGHTKGESVEALVFVDLLQGAGGGKGVVLVSGGTDGKGFVWDAATGRVRAELKHDEPITSIAAHPAPSIHLVTTASADRVLKTWDIRTGAQVAEHLGHAGVVNGVAVALAPAGESSPLGLPQPQIIVSAGDEGVSLVWRI